MSTILYLFVDVSLIFPKYRIKAILLADEGWTPQQIAEALIFSDRAVRNHIEEYTRSVSISEKAAL